MHLSVFSLFGCVGLEASTPGLPCLCGLFILLHSAHVRAIMDRVKQGRPGFRG